jgi:hypothetical protein
VPRPRTDERDRGGNQINLPDQCRINLNNLRMNISDNLLISLVFMLTIPSHSALAFMLIINTPSLETFLGVKI